MSFSVKLINYLFIFSMKLVRGYVFLVYGQQVRESTLLPSLIISIQAPVVQTMDSAICRINHYPLDNSIGFASVYPLDSDLSDV